VGGLPEVVAHGSTGLLVQPESPQALAAAIESLLAAPELAKQMGAAALRRARQVFGLQRYVDRYERLYRTLAGEPAR
jgi:glycosyltransferase involved in cell wall biosynthesis